MITLENYEIYFIEYLDGTLSEKKRAELKAFLLIHPDLNELLEDTGKIKFKAPNISYQKKDLLKKTEEQECPDYYAIAEAEAVLSPEEARQLGKKRFDNNFRKTVNDYRELKLQADKSIHYNKKRMLYRKSIYSALVIRLSAVAAVILLVVSTTWFFHQTKPERENILPIAGNSISKIAPAEIIPSTIVPLPIQKAAWPAKLKPVSNYTLLSLTIVEPVSLSPSRLDSVKIQEIPTEWKQPLLASSERSPEIILNESAQEWKASSTNFETKNIISSVISAGKNLAERTKINALP